MTSGRVELLVARRARQEPGVLPCGRRVRGRPDDLRRRAGCDHRRRRGRRARATSGPRPRRSWPTSRPPWRRAGAGLEHVIKWNVFVVEGQDVASGLRGVPAGLGRSDDAAAADHGRLRQGARPSRLAGRGRRDRGRARTRPSRGSAGRYHWVDGRPQETPAQMPHVATSPSDLLAALAARRTSTATASSSMTRPPSATRGSATSPGRPRSARTRRRPSAAQWLVWEASQALGARSASIQALYDARARGEVVRLHRPGHQHPGADVRHGPDDLRDGRRRRCRGGHPGARPERADLHVPAPDRLRDLGPRRRDRRGLARPGLHPGRPLPVQREEVRRRPRVDDRGDPAGLPAGHRCRLPEHRHRLVHARGPLEAERRTRSSARTTPAPPN